jgi:hypothetical protein
MEVDGYLCFLIMQVEGREVIQRYLLMSTNLVLNHAAIVPLFLEYC